MTEPATFPQALRLVRRELRSGLRGFGVFLSALKAASNNYGQFKICNVSPEVMELFKLLQLHHVFEIYDELDACLESFKP